MIDILLCQLIGLFFDLPGQITGIVIIDSKGNRLFKIRGSQLVREQKYDLRNFDHADFLSRCTTSAARIFPSMQSGEIHALCEYTSRR